MSKFILGEKVVTNGILVPVYRKFRGKTYKVWRRIQGHSHVGIIVRKVWKRGGVLKEGIHDVDAFGAREYEQSSLQIKRLYHAYEVAISINRKPILVQIRDIKSHE